LPDKKMGAKERILSFLTKESPEQYNASTLASILKIKKNTVTKALSRLEKEGEIEKPLKGFFRGLVSAERMLALERTDIKIHGVKIQFQATILEKQKGRFVTLRVEGLSLCHLFSPTELVQEDYWKYTYKVEILERLATIILHRGKGLVEVFIKASENPLTFTEFQGVSNFLEARLGDTYHFGDPQLIQVGLNRDYKELRLDGVNCIKLQQWMNAWQQLYNKAERVLRHEVHINTKLSLKEAIEMMEQTQDRVMPSSELELKPSSDFYDNMYQ